MAEKSLSDKFLKYALKNKILTKKDYKKGKDLEDIISNSISFVLKKETTQELAKFGTLKKQNKFIDGRNIKTVEFFVNDNFKKKLGKNKSSSGGKNIFTNNSFKIIAAAILLFVILFGAGFFVFKFFGNDIINYVNSNKTKDNEMSLKSDKEQEITKENIDLKDENVYTTEEKDLVIKIRGDKIEDMKEGEHKEELIEYNGKIYKKITYIIVKDDTLWDISFKYLDDAFRWPFIHNLNKYIINPDLIEPGDPLIIYTENK